MSRLARGYDFLAPIYDGLAGLVYGRALRRAQACHLDRIPRGARVLVIGGGTGRYLVDLLEQVQVTEVICVDVSPRMLARTQARVRAQVPMQYARVRWVLARAEEICDPDANVVEPGQIDVLAVHCLLDGWEQGELGRMAQTLGGCLKPDGVWHFSDFVPVERWPMRWWAGLLTWTMYRFFRWVCGISARQLPDYGKAFAAAGWQPLDTQHYYGKMIVAQVYGRAEGQKVIYSYAFTQNQ